MLVKLCLMASHGYPPGPGLVFHQDHTRVLKDCQPYLPGQTARPDVKIPNSVNLGPHQPEESWRTTSGFRTNQYAKIDSALKRPLMIDVQDTCLDLVLFSFEIAEQCKRQEKILQFLMSGSSEFERGGLDLSLLSDLMGIQALTFDVHEHPYSPLVYPGEFDAPKPLVDFMGDLVRSSKVTVHPDGRVLLTGSGTEMRDILSVVAEFYLSKNSTRWRKQSLLVPEFSRFDTVGANVTDIGSLNVRGVAAAPVKSPEKIKLNPEKIKLKPSPKKKNSKKVVRERDLYKRNYFHACESLLSLMMDKKRHGKAAILSLKKSGPELPDLLTQFSAGIAGTGLAVLFSVVCKMASGRVPFCASRLFSTSFGFGLVWLSWAVNRLRYTIVYFSKNASKLSLKDEEMMRSVDKSLNAIYFRAATVLAVAVLRLS